MTGALVILAVLVVVGIFLYLGELRWRRKKAAGAEDINDAEVAAPAPANQPEADDKVEKDGGAAGVSDPDASGLEAPEVCCGQHLVCEKDLLTPLDPEIVYYDDEELDRFIGRDPKSYTPEEEDEFREVLMTLRPEDVAGWARSITQRRLELPADVRDELLMLVNERRNR